MEKERYECIDTYDMVDTQTGDFLTNEYVIDLLNQQNKRIEELEAKIELLKMNESFEQERKFNLLNNQKQLAIKELENVLLLIDEIDKFDNVKGSDVNAYINERINELKGE